MELASADVVPHRAPGYLLTAYQLGGLALPAPSHALQHVVHTMAMLNSRYSRLTIALAAIIVLLLIQLVFAPLERPEAFRWRHQPVSKSQQDLQALLDYEESRYDDTLTRREALVRKYGPKPEDVVA